MMAFIGDALEISFPATVKTVEDRLLFALWREGAQCIANLGVLLGTSSGQVAEAVLDLRERGKVTVRGDVLAPLTMCHLSDPARNLAGRPFKDRPRAAQFTPDRK